MDLISERKNFSEKKKILQLKINKLKQELKYNGGED